MSRYYLRASDSDLTGGDDWNKDLTHNDYNDTDVATLNTEIAGNNATETSYAFTVAGSPGLGSWSTGDYTATIDVDTGVNKCYLSLFLSRVDNGGTIVDGPYECDAGDQDQEIEFPGTFTFTWTALSFTGSTATDRLRLDFQIFNDNHAVSTVGFGHEGSGTYLDTPWDDASATTSMSTTASTSFTSTASTSLTSSVTTTASTSATSSFTSTASTSFTSTASTSFTSTASTSFTSTASTSFTSTASTSFTSTASTSFTSTASTTASTSFTSTASTSFTSTASTSFSTSFSSTGSTSATTPPAIAEYIAVVRVGGVSSGTDQDCHYTSLNACLTDFGGLATVGGGFDGATLDDAYGTDSGDLVQAEAQLRIKCSTTGAADGWSDVSSDWITDTNHRIIIEADTGHEAQQPFDDTRYRISEGAYTCLSVASPWVEVHDLQFYNPMTGNFAYGLVVNTGGSPCFVYGCVAWATASGAYHTHYGFRVSDETGSGNIFENCYAYGYAGDAPAAGFSAYAASNGVSCVNCVAYGNTTNFELGYEVIRAINCIGWGNTGTTDSRDFAGTPLDCDFNFSEDDTAPGANSIHYTDTDAPTPDFVSLDDTDGIDLHIQSTSDAIGAGIGPAATDGDIVPTTDFDGDSRSGTTCDIGADEHVSAATTSASTSFTSTASTTASTSFTSTASTSFTSTASTSFTSTASTSFTSSVTTTASTSFTSTASTSFTSTASTSFTSTASTSFTSTASTSFTSSFTSTASTSFTSTASTSLTSSFTSTVSTSFSSTVSGSSLTTSASTSFTSTASTSFTSTASTSFTSTASTSFTSTASTSFTSSVTTTASTSFTSTASTSFTSTASTSFTSTASTSFTSTASTSFTSTASTSFTSTASTSYTSTASTSFSTSVSSTATTSATTAPALTEYIAVVRVGGITSGTDQDCHYTSLADVWADHGSLATPGGEFGVANLGAAYGTDDEGDLPYAEARLRVRCSTTGAADGYSTLPDTFVTTASNDIVVEADSGHAATMPFDTARYRAQGNFGVAALIVQAPFVTIRNLQFEIVGTSDFTKGIEVTGAGTEGGDVVIRNCIIRQTTTGNTGCQGIRINEPSGSGFLVEGCYVYNVEGEGLSTNCVAGGAAYINCTAWNNWRNFSASGTTTKAVNCLAWGSPSDTDSADFDSASWAAGTRNNFAEDGTAPGEGSINNTDTDAPTPDFINIGDTDPIDLHLQSTSDAIGAGVGPGATDGDDVPTSDLDGDSRSGTTCDIGADEYAEAATTSASTSFTSTASTSFTSTASTSYTSSVTTTASTSFTSTASTSLTSSFTSTASTSFSSTASGSSLTTSASTSFTSTASTSFTSTASTSFTTTASTSFTSTASTSFTSTASTSFTSTASTSFSTSVSSTASTSYSTSASFTGSSLTTSASTSVSSTASTSATTGGTYTLPPPTLIYVNESDNTDGAQFGDVNPTGITDLTPLMSARVFPAGRNLREIKWQVADNPDFEGVLEWDSDWLPLGGTDGYDDSDADTDDGLRTEDYEYGQTS